MAPEVLAVAERWFAVETVDDGVVRITEPHVDPFLRANLYLIRGRDRDALVDAGLGIVPLRGELSDLFDGPVVAVATHRHFDHTRRALRVRRDRGPRRRRRRRRGRGRLRQPAGRGLRRRRDRRLRAAVLAPVGAAP